MRGYFWPRTARGRLLLGAYVVVEAGLGLAGALVSGALGYAALVVGYFGMVPTLVLGLPLINALEPRIYSAAGYSTTTQGATLAVLFGSCALANAVFFTYLRSADGRY